MAEAVVYLWDECSQAFIDEANNLWSADGVTWKPRIGDPRMARKKKEEQAVPEALKSGSYFDIKWVEQDGIIVDDIYPDQVMRPAHYTANKWEVWDVLDEFFPTKPHLWTTGKYLLRAGKKGDYLEDLQKARQYLDREISQEQARRGAKP